MMIGILDLSMGNLRSVSNAVYNAGYDFTVCTNANQLDDFTHLIIPGVGAYTEAMGHVERLSMRNPILRFVESKRPLLGICLGMQILSDHGEEGSFSKGLGLIPGIVKRISTSPNLAIPHVGWNNLEIAKDHPVFAGIKSGVDFYFVHSFQFHCDPSFAYANTEYGILLTSIVGKSNVLGFQFHPEKSQANGLKLLENFCAWDGRC